MNTHKLKLVALLFVFSVLYSTPTPATAYFTTDQQAFKANSSTALFSVSFDFGFEERDVYMPIGVVRSASNTPDFVLSYDLLDKKTPTQAGNSAALVLTKDSKVQIKDGMYYLPAGNKARFTLYTIASFSADEVNDIDNLSLLVTKLPFIMKTKDSRVDAHLNPSELQYYRTPEVRL